MLQLFSINAFLKSESGEIKQFPLVFAFMKRRRANDYIAVFEKLKTVLPVVAVKEIVSDFEAAIFKAIRKCFPGVNHFGCSFHWKQAVLRKAREFGFSTQYSCDGNAISNWWCFHINCFILLRRD